MTTDTYSDTAIVNHLIECTTTVQVAAPAGLGEAATQRLAGMRWQVTPEANAADHADCEISLYELAWEKYWVILPADIADGQFEGRQVGKRLDSEYQYVADERPAYAHYFCEDHHVRLDRAPWDNGDGGAT